MSTNSVNGAANSTLNTALATLAPQTSTTGTSTFTTELQASVNRALEIASLPMQALQADQSTISGETNELSTLGNLFGSLQTALQGISSGTGSNALQATVGDSSIVTANITGSGLPGTFSIDVLDPGSTSSAESTATGVTDPTTESISPASSFSLTVGTSNYTITPATNSLNALASAINSSGAAVQAVVVNLGSPESPSYQLALQSTALGGVALQLSDPTTNNLLTTLTTGTDGSYTVNGQPPGGITTDASTVTVAPGLSVTLEAVGTTTVTVTSSLSSVSSELSSFVNAYNATFAEVEKNFGQNGGPLVGDSAVLRMQQALTQMISYQGTGGSITSLAQLGVEFTAQGTLTFNSSALSDLSQSQISDALTFLGDPNSSGFLQSANNTLNSLTTPITGLFAMETQTLQTENQNDQTEISNDQAKLSRLQTSLQAQMAQANALIATLQQQNTFLQGLFQYDTSNNPNVQAAG